MIGYQQRNRSSRQQHSKPQIQYTPQAFLYKLGKLSIRGWVVHTRAVLLDDDTLSYYKKVPKGFAANRVGTLHGQVPKYSLKLRAVQHVGIVDEKDQKSYKKLNNDTALLNFVKIRFLKTGLIEGAGQDEIQSEENEEYKERGDNSSRNKKKTSKSKGKSIDKQRHSVWYFQCEDEEQRDEVIARIYINAYNQSNDTASSRPGSIALASDEYTQEILKNFIEDQQSSGNLIILNQQISSKVDKQKQLAELQEESQEYSEESSREEEDEKDQSAQEYSKNSSDSDKKIIEHKEPPPILISQNKKIVNDIGLKEAPSNQQSASQGKIEVPDEYQNIIKQNLNINNLDKDGTNSVHHIKQINLSDVDVKKIKDSIDKIQEEQKKLEEQQQEIESKGWDLKFQNYWGYIMATGENFDQTIPMCENMFKHVGQFREHATDVVQRIIDNIHEVQHRDVPEEDKMQPLDKITAQEKIYMDEDDNFLYNMPDTGDTERVDSSQIYQYNRVYVIDSIMYRITNPYEVVYTKDSIISNQTQPKAENQLNDDDAKTQINNDKYPLSYDTRTQKTNDSKNTKHQHSRNNILQKWKLFGRQFLSMDVLFDALYILPYNEKQTILRIPLSALIDYKGFRCIAMGLIPVSQHISYEHGFSNDAFLPTNEDNQSALETLGEILHLEPGFIDSSSNKPQQPLQPIPVSFYCKIYGFSMQKDGDKEVIETSGEVSKNSEMYHFNELKYRERPSYLMNTSEIFPFDQEQPDGKTTFNRQLAYVLRPEFFTNYDTYLTSDTLKDYNFKVNNSKQNILNIQNIQKVSGASACLKREVIPSLVDMLDNLIMIPIDSESLCSLLHQHGINLRYLSHVAVKSKVPHVIAICVVEMIARTCKNIINQQLAQCILNNKIKHDLLGKIRQEFDLEIKKKEEYINKQLQKQTKFQPTDPGFDEEDLQQDIKSLENENEQVKQKQLKRAKKDMDLKVHRLLVDILNLIFGKGEETDYFWDKMILPACKEQFKVDEAIKYHEYQDSLKVNELISRKNVNLNALFYAIQYLVGFEMVKLMKGEQFQNIQQSSQFYQYSLQQKMEEFFSQFGKIERPFGDPRENQDKFQIKPRSKSYSLKVLPYTKMLDKINKFSNEQNIEEALNGCKMKKKMHFLLFGKMDLISLADIADIALDQNNIKTAIQYAEQGIQETVPLHAERVRFYCILIRAYFGLDKFKESEKYFQLATDTLSHHLGPSHPLHITVYGIMAQLMISKSKMEDASYLYKSSILVCMKSLGPNHVQTAHAHMDFAQFYMKWSVKRSQALSHFQQAYIIYENYSKQNEQQQTNIVLQADAAMQIAHLMEEQNRLNEAFEYVKVASDTYRQVYGDSKDNTIIAQWLRLQIAYSQSGNKQSNEVVELADNLFKSLVKRDLDLKDKFNKQISQNIDEIDSNKMNEVYYQGYENSDGLQEEMDNIKILCIATHVMEMTRMLSRQEKQILEKFCDWILLEKYEQDRKKNQIILKTHMEYKSKNIDFYNIRKISNITFKDKQNEEFLKHLFKKTQNSTFKVYYQGMIKSAIDQYQHNKDKKFKQIEKKNHVKQTTEDPQQTTDNLLRKKNNSNFNDVQKVISTFDEAVNRDDTVDFFDKLLDAFYQINFYNLLFWQFKDEKNNEQD